MEQAKTCIGSLGLVLAVKDVEQEKARSCSV